jgi:HK97 family phage prohead protease
MNIKRVTMPLILKADAEGQVQAVFSTFNVIDKGGDIVLASAFTHGQQVPMTWSHDWTMPVGKGQILVESDRAVFDGGFFMGTQAGQEAYKTVKEMGPLQEWSWGFRVADATFEQHDGEYVRVIKKAQVFEVSPVLVGEGEGTYTLGIKGSQPYIDHAEAVLAAVRPLVERSKSLADLRAKDGRVLSDANRRKLASLKESLSSILSELDDLLAATEPAKAADVMALFVEYQHICARMSGAA